MKIPKFNKDNWTPFKEKCINLYELTVSFIGIPLDYILSKKDRNDNRRTEDPPNIDVIPEYITKHATDYGDHFKNDKEIVFALRERKMKNTGA